MILSTINNNKPLVPPASSLTAKTKPRLKPTVTNKKKRCRKSPKDQYTEVSYENKKQKAKDNRAKLTSAIDKLEDAFRQARNGSEQRLQNYQQHQQLSSSPLSSSQNIMNDVAQTVILAHKWDRPSFIMSAADIVVKLNNQCQALMDDLIHLKKENDSHNNINNLVEKQMTKIPEDNDNSDDGKQDYHEESHSSAIFTNKNKQVCTIRTLQGNSISRDENDDNPKLMENNDTNQIKMEDIIQSSNLTVVDIPNSIIKEIATYLDPKSLLRCRRVTKLWNDFDKIPDIFTDNALWLGLCNHRYGSSQVKKWTDTNTRHHNAENIGETVGIQNHSAITMYRDMNSVNWKPSCAHNEGDLCLGDAKMDYNNVPTLSAWVTIIDRSNGETMRTVFAKLGFSEQILLIPVVEVRILLQNTGFSGQNKGSILIPEQALSVTTDEGEMFEIQSDERLIKRVIMRGKDGSSSTVPTLPKNDGGGLCYLDLYDVAELRFYIHAQSCLSTTKFVEKAKSLKLLVSILGNTVPFYVPFQPS
mmetsp:Transcript_5899/g.5493  ORF Transcript_5899/g.5493 Transcript_5899/m.5493 type:complete len:530 (-) Transcript_5899:60-1649(-)